MFEQMIYSYLKTKPMTKEQVYKSYNFKFTEEVYFKLREIELDMERKTKKQMTKNEVMESIILDYQPKKD